MPRGPVMRHPLTPEGPGRGSRPIIISEACDILSQRIRRIDRQMARADKASPKYVNLSNHKDKLISKLIGLAELHYDGRTYIPSSICRVHKT